MIWDFIINSVPWWVWAIIIVVIVGALRSLIGWQGILAGLAAIGGMFLYKRGQKDGADHITKKAMKDADKAIKRAQQVRDRANASNVGDRLRDSDKYRRDD